MFGAGFLPVEAGLGVVAFEAFVVFEALVAPALAPLDFVVLALDFELEPEAPATV
jgi:hypothetical protein